MIKTVLLDLDDTILDFKMSERVALTKTLNELSIEPTEEIIKKYSKYNISQWKRLELGEISREEVKVNRYKLLFDDIKVDASPQKATAIYEENLAHGHYFVDGEMFMFAMKGSVIETNDYNLYVVSNGAEKVQDGRMKSADINHCFKGIFVSEVVGFEKPNVEFFNKGFSQIENFNADETVIIGDSLSSDIKGGKNAKIKTVWFNPNGLEYDDIVPDFQISSLDEIKPLLATL